MNNNAAQILDNIFSIIQNLYNEMRLSKNGENDHIKVFEIFADLGRTLAGADRASFWKWDKREHLLITKAATGVDQIIISDKTGLVGRALAENRTIVTNDPENHPDFNKKVDEKTGYTTKSILVMPVSNCRGEIIGAFQVINKLGNDKGFDEIEDSKRLSIAAFICGMALESDLFLADSQRDKLTELKNRLGFDYDYQTRYQKILSDPQNNSPLSIIMCDIDFFKKVNDTYGHDAGDAVLIYVSKILRSEVKNNGNVYRWGGEEFIIILENINLSDAINLAEKIRLTVMNSVCHFNKNDLKVTMSFGCAEMLAKDSFEENVKIADVRLYKAKTTGRNKVVAD
ncbi:MAG: sensor domain-containing diguanylate cyclase [Selenomonadaceae bacterium]|nr:sensor domain-containing diguanylate cyclase [Selenomonadaceae bacterium]